MTTQLHRNLWILYYIPADYSSVLFISLHYYRPELITVTRKYDVVVVAVFLTSATVVLNHFAEGSQIQTCNFVREPPQKFCHKSFDTVCLIVLMRPLTQNIRCVSERLLRAACMFENHCSTSNTTPGSFDIIDLAMMIPKKHQRLADPLLQSDVVTIAFSVL